MRRLSLRYDMRAPSFGAPAEALYRACVEQCAWADRLGFRAVLLGEHHGADDGYCPSPIVLGGAIASVTDQLRIRLSALVAVLHHPIRLAEDLAVLDLLSSGRLELTLGIGYRPHEYEMFGVPKHRRVGLLAAAISVLEQAWTGEPFAHDGTVVVVRPRPSQRPRPRIYTGSAVATGARRAAHLGDGFDPPVSAAAIYAVYEDECRRVGKDPEPRTNLHDMMFIHVADDPEREWPIVAPHVLHTVNSFASWSAERGVEHTTKASITGLDELRDHPNYQVVTPEGCVELLLSFEPDSEVVLQPLIGGLDPDVSWRSLELIENRVLPALAEA